MFHYFNSITNIRGDALIGYFVKVIDTATGDTIDIYADQSLTPIISVSGVANAAEVDSNGNASFYVEGGEYHQDIYATDAVTLIERVENVPMSSAVDVRDDIATGAFASIPIIPQTYGALGDGAADDTDAIQDAVDDAASRSLTLHIPAGTYLVSSISIPAGVSVTTDGFNTIIKQIENTGADTRIIEITGSDVRVGDLAIEGQLDQAGDTTGEQNHGIFIYIEAADTASRSNITIGNVKGTNIRGDVVCTGVHPDAYTAGYRLSGISMGKIIGSNVYRANVSITAGSDYDIESVTGTQVGKTAFNAEQDVGSGPITGLSVGYIKGRNCQFAGPTAADYIEAWVGHIDVDPGYTTTSSPDYGGTDFHDGLIYRNCKSLRVERLYANGHYAQTIKPVTGALTRQQLTFGAVEIPSGCTTEAVYLCFILGDSTTYLTIENLFATTSAITNHAVFNACSNVVVNNAQVSLQPSTHYMRSCTDCTTLNLNVTRVSGNGGTVDLSGTRCHYRGGIQLCDYFFSFSTRCSAMGVDATAASSYDNAGTENVYLASNQGGNFLLLQDSTGNGWSEDGEFLIATGKIASSHPTFGIGYATGAGGAVTQITSKATGVTLNKVCGQVTMHNAALLAAAKVSFVVTNSAIAATDIIAANVVSGGTANAYRAAVTAVAAGSFTVTVENITAGSLSEAPVIGFAKMLAVAA